MRSGEAAAWLMAELSSRHRVDVGSDEDADVPPSRLCAKGDLNRLLNGSGTTLPLAAFAHAQTESVSEPRNVKIMRIQSTRIYL